jgi:hypothetical protein
MILLICFLDRVKHQVSISNRGLFLVAQYMGKMVGKILRTVLHSVPGT